MIDSMEQEDFDIRNQQPVTSRERDFENALRPLNTFVLVQVCTAWHSARNHSVR